MIVAAVTTSESGGTSNEALLVMTSVPSVKWHAKWPSYMLYTKTY